jgi:signal transduction histidine kinase
MHGPRGGVIARAMASIVPAGSSEVTAMETAVQLPDAREQPVLVTLQAQKLSDIGARVARVVHELNVPLSLIIGSLQTLDQYATASMHYIRATERQPRQGKALRRLRAELDLDYLVGHAPELLEICREGTRRLTHVIQQLKVYARDSTERDVPVCVDLRKVLRDAISLAGCGRDVVPNVECDLGDFARVAGSAESLAQAFVNVLGNAFDAVATVVEPTVWVSGCTDWPRAASVQRRGWVEVRIRDNGPGISDADRRRIFEPFFTTKSRRSGMGLGLAIAKEIVESHGGTIILAAPVSCGAEFVIRLPTGDESVAL